MREGDTPPCYPLLWEGNHLLPVPKQWLPRNPPVGGMPCSEGCYPSGMCSEAELHSVFHGALLCPFLIPADDNVLIIRARLVRYVIDVIFSVISM